MNCSGIIIKVDGTNICNEKLSENENEGENERIFPQFTSKRVKFLLNFYQGVFLRDVAHAMLREEL